VKTSADRRVTVDAELLDGHGAAPELHPECRLVANSGMSQRTALKTAADTVLGVLSHLYFLGLGALGTGLLFVCSAVVVRDFERRITTESFAVDARRVTVPIIEPPRPAVSAQPRSSDKPVTTRPPSDSAIRPELPRPAAPTGFCIDGHCAGDIAPPAQVP
jgi:hypothetical protein